MSKLLLLTRPLFRDLVIGDVFGDGVVQNVESDVDICDAQSIRRLICLHSVDYVRGLGLLSLGLTKLLHGYRVVRFGHDNLSLALPVGLAHRLVPICDSNHCQFLLVRPECTL